MLKLAAEMGWQAEGVDFDSQAVAAAKRKGLLASFGRLAEQRYAAGSFHLAYVSHVIEHVHDPLATFAEISRVLRPGGMLAVTTPNADSWGHRHFDSSWAALDPPRHLRIFNEQTLGSLAKRAGFAQATLSSTLGTTPFVFVQSALIGDLDRGDMGRPPMRSEKLYSRGNCHRNVNAYVEPTYRRGAIVGGSEVSIGSKVSIAMAVYNGERFIQEQLDSYVRQTRLPDELVVSDNASTDRTVEIVRAFAQQAPFRVRLFINESNLGVTKIRALPPGQAI